MDRDEKAVVAMWVLSGVVVASGESDSALGGAVLAGAFLATVAYALTKL